MRHPNYVQHHTPIWPEKVESDLRGRTLQKSGTHVLGQSPRPAHPQKHNPPHLRPLRKDVTPSHLSPLGKDKHHDDVLQSLTSRKPSTSTSSWDRKPIPTNSPS